MNKVDLTQENAVEITSILLEEELTGVSKTLLLMTKYKCSRPYVTILRNNYRSNGKKVILKPRKLPIIKNLQSAALKKGERFFTTGTPCKFCETDLRYTSTCTCAECMKSRSSISNLTTSERRLKKLISREAVPSFPIYNLETRIASGLNL